MPNYRKMAIAAAKAHGISPRIFLAQIAQESGFNPHAHSSAGALGIAQFMPATAAGYHINPMHPAEALDAAARMDAGNLKKYGSYERMLSAYNSGRPDAYKDPHFAKGQTYNYVRKIMGAGGNGSDGGGTSTPTHGLGGAQRGNGGSLGDVRQAVALALLGAAQNGGHIAPGGLMALAQARHQANAAQDTFGPQPTQGGLTRSASKGGNINEMFYDPLGGIKHGQHIAAIGGHNDHVHVSLSTAGAQRAAINRAKAMGMHVGEDGVDGKVHQVHVGDSYHYRTYNKKSNLRMAADVSGSPQQMAAYFKWVQGTFG